MTIYIDTASPPPSGPPSPTGSLMTSSLNTNLETALTSLRTKFPDIEGAITGNVIVTTFREGFPSTSTPTTGVYFHWAGYAGWYSNLETYLASKSIPYDKTRDTVILLMPSEIGPLELGSYKTPDIGGLPNVDFNHQRLLFHELMHVVSLYDQSVYNAYTKGNSPTVDPWEADTIALAGENILYAQETPGAGLAGGHGGSASAGFSGINTFLALAGEAEVNQTIVDGATAFVFSESDGGLTTRKIIFERGVNPEGADETKLNHYILNEIESEDNLIEANGSLTPLLGTAVAHGNSDSASSNFADKVQKTRETLDGIQDFADTRPLKFVPQNVNAVLDALPQLDQTRARMLSLETSSVRLATVVEVQGPQKADETTGSNNGSATYLSIAAGGSAALLVGGAGFSDRNVDFSNRLDDLYGSDEDDYIVGGDGLATGDDRSILDGRGGNDVIVTGSGLAHAKGGDGDDIILAGSGDTKVDGGKGTDLFAFYDHAAAWKIDLSDENSDGYGLAEQAGEEVRIKDVEIFYGGGALTTFIGSGKGKGSTFIAGTGGADFTLRAGDQAFGYAGVKDIYRISTKKDFVSEESAIDYLSRNDVYIGNFGPEDEIWVNGVKFNGNKVSTALLGEMVATDKNRDDPHNSIVMTGDSSYGTAYASAVFEPRGLSWGGDPWGALVYNDMQVRDASYAIADETGLGMMTFFTRGITGHEDGGGSIHAGETGFTYNELTENDEMLTVVIDGFQNGYGGITFQQDALANLLRPNPHRFGIDSQPISYNFATDWYEESLFWVDESVDILDGNQDGIMSPGGGLIGIDDPNFNYGYMRFGEEPMDWDVFFQGPQNLTGTSGSDSLVGGGANDVLSGGDDDDFLEGGPGNDLLDGGAGNDTIWGDDGNDTLLGGDGDDWLNGGSGNNIIDGGNGTDLAHFDWSSFEYRIYRKIDGTVVVQDMIEPADINFLSNVEKLFFGTDEVEIDVDDIPMGTSGNDVLVGSSGYDVLDGGAGDDTLSGGDGDDIYVVDSSGDIVIENASEGEDTVQTSLATYSLAANVENLIFLGSGTFAGTGNALNNSIIGGTGNDSLAGGDGDDRFVAGGGVDAVDGGDGWDVLELSGKAADYSYSADGLGVTRVSDGTNSIDLTNVEEVLFSDGQGFDLDTLVSMFVTGTAGNDAMLEGDSDSDQIRGWAGDDNLRGGGGSDVLDGGDGNDTAYFSGASADYWIFYNSMGGLAVGDNVGSEGWDLLSNIEALHFDGDNVTINVSTIAPLGTSGADTIVGSSRQDRLYGLAGNDNLSGGDRQDYLYGGTGNDVLDGGSGDDSLYGEAGNDVNVLGTGNDLAWDVSGDDSYVYEAGDGADRIRDDGGTDAIILGSAITPGDVTFSVDDDDIILTFAGGGSLTIQNGLVEGSEIEEIRFDDNTIWNPIVRLQTPTSGNDTLIGTILADTLSGDSGNDMIEGRQGNDTLSGDTGDDTLSGGAGDDTYLFALGDGVDIIKDASINFYYGRGGNDTLIFGAGIAPIDIQVSVTDGRNLVLTIAGTTDKVTLRDSLMSSDENIETVQFADTTIWTHADLMSRVLVSTSGDDSLYGSFAAETISGGAGNDYILARDGDDIITGGTGNDNLTGGAGNDTYYFNPGDGQDYIHDYTNDVATSLDKIVFGAGILASDIIVTQTDNGRDLVLSIAGTSDKITINDAAFATGYRMEEIHFADSTVWTHADLMVNAYSPKPTSNTYWGTSGADIISGGGGNDLIVASGGDDILAGGTGNDTLHGDAGTDTVLLMGLRPTYSMLTSGGYLKVTDNAPTVDDNDGTDELRGVEKLRFSDNEEIGIVSPIILDLDGGGVTTVSAYVGRARYDMDGDGIADITSWMGRGEGMLFLDRDGDGTLSNAGEFSFAGDVESAASDLVGLRAFDSNGDGALSSADGRFADFRIWRDGNGDGGVQNGEIVTLADAGIASLDLFGQAVDGETAIGDVAVLNAGNYTRTDGGTGQFIDAALTYFSGASTNGASSTMRQQYRPLSRRQLDVIDRDGLRGLRREPQVDWQYARDPIAQWPQRGDQRMWSGPAALAVDDREQPAGLPISAATSVSSVDRQLAMIVQEMSAFGAKSAGEGLGPWQREHVRAFEFFA